MAMARAAGAGAVVGKASLPLLLPELDNLDEDDAIAETVELVVMAVTAFAKLELSDVVMERFPAALTLDSEEVIAEDELSRLVVLMASKIAWLLLDTAGAAVSVETTVEPAYAPVARGVMVDVGSERACQTMFIGLHCGAHQRSYRLKKLPERHS
jgi:hypothetical protein